jgi:vancomycin resistance protein VanJ
MNTAERGFALSFPATLPPARIDQVMSRSATVAHIRTLPATGSDHLPVTARITLGRTGESAPASTGRSRARRRSARRPVAVQE